MGVLDIVSYWWPGIAAILFGIYGVTSSNPLLFGVAAVLVVLQVVVVFVRGGLFVARETKARSAQDRYDE
jgi:hypothetical protein